MDTLYVRRVAAVFLSPPRSGGRRPSDATSAVAASLGITTADSSR
jgi:hypothetical protein